MNFKAAVVKTRCIQSLIWRLYILLFEYMFESVSGKSTKNIEFIHYWWVPAAKVFFSIIAIVNNKTTQKTVTVKLFFFSSPFSHNIFCVITNKCALSIKLWLPHRQNNYWNFCQCLTHQQLKHCTDMRSIYGILIMNSLFAINI